MQAGDRAKAASTLRRAHELTSVPKTRQWIDDELVRIAAVAPLPLAVRAARTVQALLAGAWTAIGTWLGRGRGELRTKPCSYPYPYLGLPEEKEVPYFPQVSIEIICPR